MFPFCPLWNKPRDWRHQSKYLFQIYIRVALVRSLDSLGYGFKLPQQKLVVLSPQVGLPLPTLILSTQVLGEQREFFSHLIEAHASTALSH